MDPWVGIAVVAAAGVSAAGAFVAMRRSAAVQRRKAALAIHDDIVQGLAAAKIAFEMGRIDEGLIMIEVTLETSRRMIADLMGGEGRHHSPLPGDFRRPHEVGTR